MLPSVPGDPAPADDGAQSHAGIRQRIDDARKKLVETSLRNRLINTALESSRSRSLRCFGELSDQVFGVLVAKKGAMDFRPVPDPQGPREGDEAQEESPDYLASLPLDDATRTSDTALQTRLVAQSLETKLKNLYYESREYEEEQGVNVLYLALGFLRWYESPTSDIARHAPLVLLPVELVREGARNRYRLKIRDDDLFTNVSLKLFLAEHGATLPDIPEDEGWTPGSYTAAVREAIAQNPRWEVLPDEIFLGFFSFSKFLLWRDLDPKHWPQGKAPHQHAVVGKLLAPASARAEQNPPLIPPDAKIDDHFTPRDLMYVLDADSSQTEAIQTVLAGRDLTIQGPPGTGKSQTIANVIAAAVAQSKRILFVAEKMAALEVVHRRLTQAGLGPLCLELHSRKATKTAVHAQLKAALDLPNTHGVAEGLLDQLEARQRVLNTHAAELNEPLAPAGFTPFEVLGAICRLHREGIPAPDFDIPEAAAYGKAQLAAFTAELDELAERLRRSGVPDRHPWRLATGQALSPFAAERLAGITQRASAALREALACLDTIAGPLRLAADALPERAPAELGFLGDLLAIARRQPALPAEVLACFALTRQGAALEVLQQRLTACREARAQVSAQLAPGWEQSDLQDLRQRYASTGGGLFSFLNGTYRRSLAALKGLARPPLPRGFAARLKLLDDALLASSRERLQADLDPTLLANLGPLWRGFDTDADAIDTLLAWVGPLAPVTEEHHALVLALARAPAAQQAVERLQPLLDELGDCARALADVTGMPAEAHAAAPLAAQAAQWALWQTSLARYNDWPGARDLLARLAPRLGTVFHQRIWRGDLPPEALRPQAEIALYERVWGSISARLPQLAELDAYRLDETVASFRELDRQRLAVAAQQILASYAAKRPTGTAGEMGTIRAEMNKRRNHYSVRRLMREAGHAVQALKPVFLMSPLSVAQYLPPGLLEFDLVLIDEASQVRPEDALGAIARARQIVTVGDDKQLPPTNFFNRLVDDSVEAELQQDEFSIGDIESILSLSNITLPDQAMLRWHYRSQHPGLIAVSNRNFYENKLLLPPSTLRTSYGGGLGVSMVRSPANGYARGGADGGRNVLEAELIANAVMDFAREHPKKSLGVAAFSVKQRDAIRDLVDQKRQENPDLDAFFASDRPDHFFIKNLESIQGDERDVIFISVGYGRDANGRLTQAFGPLGATGGERRLNVLISRARERCTVFSSITADDVRDAPGKAGVQAFREFLQYAEKGYFDVPETTRRDYGSEFEESVAMFLRQHGYEIHPQVGMAGFFIDLGVVHPDIQGRYLCGVECDGATYHSSRSARDRDRLRQAILESRGWKLYRIWSTDWFHRRQQQEQKLLDALIEMRARLAGETKEPPEAPPAQPASAPKTETIAHTDPVAPPYVEFRETIRTAGEPHTWPSAAMTGIVERIVRVEGPVHEEEIGRRVSRAAGFSRAGARIQDAVKAGLMASSTLTHDGPFWQVRGAPVVVRNRAQVESTTLQKAQHLPPVEIALAIEQVVKASVRIGREELIQQVSRVFGFARCGQELREGIGTVIADVKAQR
jgi:very-short-patch-repair endonuclease